VTVRVSHHAASVLTTQRARVCMPSTPPAPHAHMQGELAFRALSYTPWPVPEDAPGTRLRIPVGPTADCQLRTFVFEQQLPGRSEQVMVTLPRPLGARPTCCLTSRQLPDVCMGHTDDGVAALAARACRLP